MLTDLNVRPYNNKESLLFPALIGDYLPKDHLAHIVDEAVEEINLGPYYQKISSVGNPMYHPALMIKVWFYGYATRTYSSRKIEEKLHSDVAFIYLAGMQRPDFKAISEFRRKNLKELRDSFIEILQICHRLGMVKLGEISVDSKVMKGNASSSRMYTEGRLIKERKEIEKVIEEYLAKVHQTDEEEDESFGFDKSGHELPEDIRDKRIRIKKMQEIVKELKTADEKLKRSEQKKINLTDEDARFQKGTSGVVTGYRGQIAVDSKEQIIVANEVSNEQSDTPQLVPMVDKILEKVNELVPDKFNKTEEVKVIADAGYSSGKNLSELEKEKYRGKIEVYIPDTNSPEKERGKGYDVNSPFHRSKFIYDERENLFICPTDKTVAYVGTYPSYGVKYHIYENRQDCLSCQYNGECNTGKKGRRLTISEYQSLVDKMRQKLSTVDGKKIYAKRKITVEPVFGNLSQNLGFREFLLRGLEKVKGEFSLMCTAHNLLKIARFVRGLGINLKEALGQGGNSPLFDTS